VNLVGPYVACLVIASLFGIVPVWSLWRSGIVAADGGFLQVMMATPELTDGEACLEDWGGSDGQSIRGAEGIEGEVWSVDS
jgi:hypothetical protein